MNAQLSALQEQVNSLFAANLNVLRPPAGLDGLAYPPPSSASPSLDYPLHTPTATRHHSFRGPTSSVYNLNVAKKTLHSMGYQSLADGDEGTTPQGPSPRLSPATRSLPPPHSFGQPVRDPIWSLSKEEALRLIRVYEEDMCDLYPVIDLDQVTSHVKHLFDYVDPALRNGAAHPNVSLMQMKDNQTVILKMVLACAAITETHGVSDIGHRLFESMRDTADRMLHSAAIDVEQFPFLILVVSSSQPRPSFPK